MSSVCISSQQMVSVLLVDDEPRFRQGLQTLLNFYNTNDVFKFNVVGEAASAEQALKLAEEQHPTLILLDMELAAQDGIAVLMGLSQISYKGKVLVLSGHREDEWVFRAMQAGANGYVFKDQLATQLCNAINTVMNGQVYLSPEVATGFFHLFHFYSGRSLEAKHKLHLTDREQEVLDWLVQGVSNEEIANHLFVTVATVKAHLTAIFTKLGVTSRTQAIIKALKLGLVSC
ncbi:response regulator [Pantanalinema rosaneae CENA516]|uniref:response regulator n=1 Tax=Pantanalinema rosaneae TaxID=1620701 RepID=UPI003D6F756D